MAPANNPPFDQIEVVSNQGLARTDVDYRFFLDCVHCGLCVSSCPTYLETGNEADSPRGRIHLMRAAIDGRLQLDQSVRRHLDLCLDCRGCESACPSGVQYGRLIESFRIGLEKNPSSSKRLNVLQRLILFHVAPFSRRTRLALKPARLLQSLKLNRLADRGVLSRFLPESLKQLYEVVPRRAPWRSRLPMLLPAEGRRRARVGLFTGCAADAFFPETNWAAARVLQRNGCEVWIPRNQVCCGALHYHLARPKLAAGFASRNCKVFLDSLKGPAPLDAIVTTAAGCGAFLKNYPHLLAQGPFHSVGTRFSRKVRDISEYLIDLPCIAPNHPVPVHAVYHDACHLRHAQQIQEHPRKLLEMIPALKLTPLVETEICCGAAGSYGLTEPEMAARLGRRKAANIVRARVDMAFAANVGCLLHIGRFLRERNTDVRLAHPVDAIWASYSGGVSRFLQRSKDG